MESSTVRHKSPLPVFGVLLWLIFATTGWTQNSGIWETRAPLPQSRQELPPGWLNGKLYVIGGYDAGAHSTGTVQV